MSELDENSQANSPILIGRRKIFSTDDVITKENIIEVLNLSLAEHVRNMEEEEYLYWYRRGLQPVLYREKEVRPEICAKIVVNNAAMVTTFKNGYFLTRPVNYVSRTAKQETVENVRKLNEYIYASGKHHADNETVDWFHTVGLGVIYLEPNRENRPRKPVNVYALDPRSNYCVYSLAPGNRTVMGVHMVTVKDKILFDVFTDDSIFHLSGGTAALTVGSEESIPKVAVADTLVSVERNRIGLVPMVEYQYNASHMSSFENAIPLMNAINEMESCRSDATEQAVQQLCIAYNCQFEEGTTANTIRQAGMICLKSVGENKADFKILESNLDQSDTQTAIDSLYDQMLEKCGVPSSVRDGGSTSDNTGAVYLRSGWAAADTDARNTEDYFRESDARFMEVFLKILAEKNLLTGLEPEDFEPVFVRNSMDNLLAKTQAALNMKLLGLSPEIAFERSGLSNDPAGDVEKSQKYIKMMWTKPEKEVSPNQSTDPNRNENRGNADPNLNARVTPMKGDVR